MTAGNLDRRIQFRRQTSTNTGLGVETAWADHGSPVWASRKDVSDGERAAAGWTEASVRARFTVRSSTFSRGITPADRFMLDGREWSIVGIKEIGRRDMLEITAETVQ